VAVGRCGNQSGNLSSKLIVHCWTLSTRVSCASHPKQRYDPDPWITWAGTIYCTVSTVHYYLCLWLYIISIYIIILPEKCVHMNCCTVRLQFVFTARRWYYSIHIYVVHVYCTFIHFFTSTWTQQSIIYSTVLHIRSAVWSILYVFIPDESPKKFPHNS
jgi:hypothetical protein